MSNSNISAVSVCVLSWHMHLQQLNGIRVIGLRYMETLNTPFQLSVDEIFSLVETLQIIVQTQTDTRDD